MPIPYQTMENLNATGIVGALQTNSAATIAFPSMFLLSVWIIISLGNHFALTRRYGSGDPSASIVIGGFVASIIGGLSMIIPKFMPPLVLSITIIFEIIAFVIFLVNRNLRNE